MPHLTINLDDSIGIIGLLIASISALIFLITVFLLVFAFIEQNKNDKKIRKEKQEELKEQEKIEKPDTTNTDLPNTTNTDLIDKNNMIKNKENNIKQEVK